MKTVLFLHATSAFGGASRSLAELGIELQKNANLHIIAPNGRAASYFRKAGFNVICSRISQFNHTEHGFYRGLRWLVLIREFFFLPGSLISILFQISIRKYHLVHLNDINLLPYSWIFKKFKIPTVVHVRCVCRKDANSLRDRWFLYLLTYCVDHIIAIDETVRDSLPRDLPVSVIHNGLHFQSGYPVPRKFSSCSNAEMNVCMVGSLLPSKGVYEFAQSCKILSEYDVNIKFHLLGENVRRPGVLSPLYQLLGLSRDVEHDLRKFVDHHGLNDVFKFHGFVDDIRNFYAHVDVLCFPSHLNAPGRPVFEAAYFGVPAIVAVERPTSDTIVHGATGLVIPNSSGDLLAESIMRLYCDRKLLQRLGDGARHLAMSQYSLAQNAKRVLGLYDLIIK